MSATATYEKKAASGGGACRSKKRKRKTTAVAKKANGSASATKLNPDAKLVKRCLAGDDSAWQELYDLCQPKLLVTVQSLIGKNGQGTNLAEEITSRVWLTLVDTGKSILDRYDSRRGSRLTTFLASLARHELLKYWRGEQRREKRERRALQVRPRSHMMGVEHSKLYWHEFLETLTQREREFVEKALFESPEEPQADQLTSANTWQLRRRVMAKLKHYFNH